MGMKSPQKNFTLDYLLKIKSENYGDIDKGIDFAPDEVDQLIWAKEPLYYSKQVFNRGELPPVFHKWCRSCKKLKLNTDFHIDNSKILKRRSHCKICRKKTPF